MRYIVFSFGQIANKSWIYSGHKIYLIYLDVLKGQSDISCKQFKIKPSVFTDCLRVDLGGAAVTLSSGNIIIEIKQMELLLNIVPDRFTILFQVLCFDNKSVRIYLI